MRAKARYQRWKEELKIVNNEMKWTMKWFSTQEERWNERAGWAKDQELDGHKCYAEKQVYLWGKMWEKCIEAWGEN